jgi:hypothetical protein
MTDYAKGFKDGFAAGLEEGKKIAPKEQTYNPWIDTGPYVGKVKESCPKCGIKISGVMGYVCSSPNCPTFPQVTCGTPMTGAVGPMPTQSWNPFYNDLPGPMDYNDFKETYPSGYR